MAGEFYYKGMDKREQEAYRNMMAGFSELLPEFPVRLMENRELADILFRLRLDHPEIFYVSGFRYRYYPDSEYVRMQPEYVFDRKKIREHQKALEGRISRLVRQAAGGTREEKERFVHDFICSGVTYDKLKKQYSHEITGPLLQGVGVCEGIAKTVKILCGRLGLESVIAVSEADPENGVRYRHAWNLINLGNAWYHLDATFDNSLGRYGQKRFDYYNLDDSRLFRDHGRLVYPVPSCRDGSRFYYREQKLSLTGTEEVAKRMKTVLKKKQPYFVFHWRGGSWNREVLDEIHKTAAEAAAEKGKFVRISVNAAQAVLQISVLDTCPENGIFREEADEGESS